MSEKKVIGLEEIMGILPHRPPFLFVDEVTEFKKEKRILARRFLRADEPHFSGHFPGRPLMPGVLITEALAQTAGLLIALTAMEKGEGAQGRMFYLAKANMKWQNPAFPGETLLLEAEYLRTMGDLFAFNVRARTAVKDVAEGSLVLARVE
jgi:3-hydroxymyristoyl/3-hydroxydecanoyl-(acyl carrier protein) dehydratase